MGFCAKTQQIFFAEFCDETAHSRQPNMCWQKVGPNWQKVNAKLANLAIKQANRRTTRDWQNMPQQMLYIYRWKYLDYKKNSSKVFSGHDMEENDAWVWNLSRNSSSAPSYECYWLYFKKKNSICVYCWEWKLWRQTVAAKLPFDRHSRRSLHLLQFHEQRHKNYIWLSNVKSTALYFWHLQMVKGVRIWLQILNL